MFGMPLAIMPLLRKTMGLSLAASGYPGADGAEQVVPGQIVLFGFFVAGSTAFALFREHGWRTWDRLRASPASPRAILIGFAIPWTCVHAAYQTVLLLAGGLVFGLRLNDGSPGRVGAPRVGVRVLRGVDRAPGRRDAPHRQPAPGTGQHRGTGVGRDRRGPDPDRAAAGMGSGGRSGHPAVLGDGGPPLDLPRVGRPPDVWPSLVVLVSIGLVASALAVVRFREDETKEFFA